MRRKNELKKRNYFVSQTRYYSYNREFLRLCSDKLFLLLIRGTAGSRPWLFIIISNSISGI